MDVFVITSPMEIYVIIAAEVDAPIWHLSLGIGIGLLKVRGGNKSGGWELKLKG